MKRLLQYCLIGFTEYEQWRRAVRFIVQAGFGWTGEARIN